MRVALVTVLLAYLASLFLPWATGAGGGPFRFDGWDEHLGPYSGSAAAAAVLWTGIVRRERIEIIDQHVLLLAALAAALGGLTLVNTVWGLWRDPQGREHLLYGAWVGAGILTALSVVVATAVLRQRRTTPSC